MDKLYNLITVFILTGTVTIHAQNVGIGTMTPIIETGS
jgi:hypothetical protein